MHNFNGRTYGLGGGGGGGGGDGGKRDSYGGRNRDKLRKILQHFVIFCNGNGTKSREPLRKGVET